MLDDFDRFNRQFDEDWNRGKRWFGFTAIFSVALSLAFTAVVIWAIIQLVQWVVAK